MNFTSRTAASLSSQSRANLNLGNDMKIDVQKLKENKRIPKIWVIEELNRRSFKIQTGRDMVLFVCYFLLFIGIVTLHSEINLGNQMQKVLHAKVVSETLLGTAIGFEELNSPQQMFLWMGTILLPVVYHKNWYSGDPFISEIQNTIGYQTKTIGGLRLKQERRKTHSGESCYSSIFDKITDRCIGEVNDRDPYPCILRSCCTSGLAKSPETCCANATSCSYSDVSGALEYQELGADEGYIHDFNLTISLTNAKKQVDALKEIRWIDSESSTVKILMTAYNPNFKRFMAIDFKIEISLVGFVDPILTVHVLDLDPYNPDNPAYASRMAVDILWIMFACLFTIWNIVKIVSLFMLPGGKIANILAYGNMGHFIGIALTVLDFVIIGYFRAILEHDETDYVLSTLNSYNTDGDDNRRFVNPAFSSYVSLSEVGSLHEQLTSAASILLLFQVLMALHAFRVLTRAEQLMNSLTRAVPDMLGFLPLYSFILIGYSVAGHILYGEQYEGFNTVANAFFSVFEINFALLDLGPLWEIDTAGSHIFVTSAVLVFTMILLNIVLSIIMSAWEVTNRQLMRQKKKEDIGISPCTVFSAFRDILQDTAAIRTFAIELRKEVDDVGAKSDEINETIPNSNLRKRIQERKLSRDLTYRMLMWFSLTDESKTKVFLASSVGVNKDLKGVQTAHADRSGAAAMEMRDLSAAKQNKNKMDFKTTKSPLPSVVKTV